MTRVGDEQAPVIGRDAYLFQKQGCYAVARFLERVSVLRRVVLDE